MGFLRARNSNPIALDRRNSHRAIICSHETQVNSNELHLTGKCNIVLRGTSEDSYELIQDLTDFLALMHITLSADAHNHIILESLSSNQTKTTFSSEIPSNPPYHLEITLLEIHITSTSPTGLWFAKQKPIEIRVLSEDEFC